MLAVTTDTPTPKGRSRLRARTETGDIGGENESEKCDGSTPGDRHCLTLLAVFHPHDRGTHTQPHILAVHIRTHAQYIDTRIQIDGHRCIRTPMAVSDGSVAQVFLLYLTRSSQSEPR